MKKILLLSLLLVGCAQSGPTGNPRILLIGDSVTHGYASKLYVTALGKAKVSTTMDNCRNSFYTTKYIDRWMSLVESEMIYDKLDRIDIIVWNNGLWNAMNPTAEVYGRTDAQYVEELTFTANRMKYSGARVIFTLTTEIPEGARGVGFLPEQVDHLNKLAIETLTPMGVEILDLNAASKHAEHLAVDDVHYSSAGYQVLADAVWAYIQGEK